jgi:membrane protein YdbS with pleckstrin-like domain
MSALFELVARFLAVPPAPDAPPGDEGATRVFRASSRYYYYRLVAWAARQVLVLVALFSAATSLSKVGLSDIISMIGVPVLLLELLISYAAVRLDYEKRWYLVTNRSLRIREGVVRVSEITISFANIQNVSISQGPVQRMLGISDLRVDTAGGGGAIAVAAQSDAVMHTAFFRGVDNAERIRELIQVQLRGHKDSGLGDPDDVQAAAQISGTGLVAEDPVVAALRQIRAAARELNVAAGAPAPDRARF